MFLFSGFPGEHAERSSTNLFSRGSPSVGEDAGRDESWRREGLPSEEEGGRLGQVNWAAVQLQCNGGVSWRMSFSCFYWTQIQFYSHVSYLHRYTMSLFMLCTCFYVLQGEFGPLGLHVGQQSGF